MKFIIFICSHIQHGEYPRLPEFPYNETLGKYIYQGRELTLEEFNEASAKVFDPFYPSDRYRFQPLAIDNDTAAKIGSDREAKAKAEESLRQSRTEPDLFSAPVADIAPTSDEEPIADSVETPDDAPRFSLDGNDIFFEGQRVAGIYEDAGLRCGKGFAHLRDEIEAWLNTNPQ